MADPLPKFACVDTTNPEAWAQCDRCSFWYNRSDLTFQVEWGGMHLYNKGILVCTTGNNCYDLPQEQFRTIILPPDPPPIVNARVPNFDYEEQTVIQLQLGGTSTINNRTPPWQAGPNLQLTNQNGASLIWFQYPQITEPS